MCIGFYQFILWLRCTHDINKYIRYIVRSRISMAQQIDDGVQQKKNVHSILCLTILYGYDSYVTVSC